MGEKIIAIGGGETPQNEKPEEIGRIDPTDSHAVKPEDMILSGEMGTGGLQAVHGSGKQIAADDKKQGHPVVDGKHQ